MSTHKNSSEQCIQISELTPKQLESLPFVPGVLSNFNEKEKLPPTARAQWAYVQLNPTDYLQRFTNELGLQDVNVALCFINKEVYEDREKDLKTPITVNLIVRPDHYEDVKQHLLGKRLSHQEMEDQKGFVLPFLGSIQKALDTLELEPVMNFLFIKNSISRESYSTWISIPKSYLEIPKQVIPQVKKTLEKTEKSVVSEKETEEVDYAQSKPPQPSQSRKKDTVKENFNYVVYDDTQSSPPTIVQPVELPKSNSVIVANKPPPPKKSLFSKFKTRPKPGKTKKVTKAKVPSPCPTAKYDSALFLSLGLFNFFCSVLLVAFLSSVLVEVQSIQMEATTFGALVSLLLTILVIRPGFKFSQSRFWLLSAYTAYACVAGYQIFLREDSPFEFQDYLTTAAVAIVCFTTALIASFKRVDRLSFGKNKKSKSKNKAEDEDEEPGSETELQVETPAPTIEGELANSNIPPPIKSSTTKNTGRKVVIKLGKTNPETKESGVGTTQSEAPPIIPFATRKSIPSQPISEEQKDVIRNRLTRKDRLTTPANSNGKATSTEGRDMSPRQLTTEEIKAQLASRLQRSSSIGKEVGRAGNPEEPTDKNATVDSSSERRTISLKKPDQEKSLTVPK
jgi:hypothetical protein